MPPGVPRFVRASAPGGGAVALAWSAPLEAGTSAILRYEVAVIDPDGTMHPFEPTTGPELGWTVRGLALDHRYGFVVRAVNATGPSPTAPTVHAVPTIAPAPVARPPGQQIPLLDAARQSLIVRLADRDCRIFVWWQPSDEGWWASLEVPANTPVVRSRRLAVNTGLLDRIRDVLPGNLVCRVLGGPVIDPGRQAWGTPATHGLIWEPE